MSSVATRIDFYRLSRPVQDRFAAATRLSVHPAPILFERASRTRIWALLAAGVLLLILEFVLLRAGWGDARSALARHGVVMIVIDIAILCAAIYCMLHAAGMVVTAEKRPWRPGLYLFPATVVDARDAGFRVWSVTDSTGAERLSRPARLAMRMGDGSSVVIRAADDATVDRAIVALDGARRELARAEGAGESTALAELDPLHDLALSSPIGPTARMTPSLTWWVRLDWLLALVVGGLLGRELATTRNHMSDDAMYGAAVAADSADAYEQYLRRGEAHAPDVRDVLLPRAQLRLAEGEGTIEAVQAFADAHKSSKIGPEIDAALRRATLAELAKAKRAGTVSALDTFAHKYPTETVAVELAAARHALFAKALAEWRAKSHPDAGTGAFMERLLAWAEKNGRPCEVRFRWKPSSSMDAADKAAMGSRAYPGPDALPSRYVTGEALRPHEQRVQDAIAAGFAAAFPSDVLTVRPGVSLLPDSPTPVDPPTLAVEYSPEWSRANTANAKPLTVFAGLIFTFEAVFTVPEGPPWKTTVKAWRGAESWKLKNEQLSREEFQQRVYDTMIDGAFDQLQRKVMGVFF
jgi:hypothetical protein